MDFAHSPRTQELLTRLTAFQEREIGPREEPYHRELLASADPFRSVSPVIDELKAKAREEGLWNLFLPPGSEVAGTKYGAGLANVEYAPLAEHMGRSLIASEVYNCSAPDTGNMEVLLHFGSEEQRERWLVPLLEGSIRSAFCMTEPDVASSDATNMQATAALDGEEVVLNGRKWWSTGVGHPNCGVLIFMGVTDPDADRYHQHSMVLVPLSTPGVKVERMLGTMGFLDAPSGHGEVSFTDVRLPASAIVGGPGQAFAIAQARLGPGRIHHCMRLIGLAELALELACVRAGKRVAFGKPLANLGGNRERIADARIAIDQARLHVLHAAWLIDTDSADAFAAVSQIKVAVPNMAQRVVDMAIQLHGGAGLSDEVPLAAAWTVARALRLADGPDEVHRGVIARLELARHGIGKWAS
ncbi:MAG TPA: acyl-CoA dehydrogenase family protein [Solirubrobacteraceae bacterium]|nr:acyl-CoA dehydrogenase family protein [Solirubrobacteraceae bacterium]